MKVTLRYLNTRRGASTPGSQVNALVVLLNEALIATTPPQKDGEPAPPPNVRWPYCL